MDSCIDQQHYAGPCALDFVRRTLSAALGVVQQLLKGDKTLAQVSRELDRPAEGGAAERLSGSFPGKAKRVSDFCVR